MEYFFNDPELKELLIQYLITVAIILILTIISFIVLYEQISKRFK